MTGIDDVRAVADAVLYEGYVLYPYRASAEKNRVRWQWGVLMPADVVARDPSERAAHRTDVVVDGAPASVRALVRFLHVVRRVVEDRGGVPVDRLEVGDVLHVPWEEARPWEHEVLVPLEGPQDLTVEVPGATWVEELPGGAGRLVRTCAPLTFGVVSEVRRPHSPYDTSLVTVRVENRTGPAGPGEPDGERGAWLHRALVACHVVLEVEGASFLSQTDPPEWASALVAECANDGVFPVLAGPPESDRLVLSAPIILYDHVQVAPQSASAFFDGLEVDELLSLRTGTLSEAEKREARGTDPRVAALLDEVDAMPPELWERLHGAVRSLDDDVPWWDPGADASVDPEHDAVRVGETDVRRGTRVLLRPGVRRADAHDLLLAGRAATVAAVLHDVDGRRHLAVTVDEDPAAELMTAHGRYLYFAPDEVEPLGEGVDP